MTDPELMPIGAFAKLAGLTASALRFYDDAGLLRPDQVDPVTGYRLYGRSQLTRAVRLRRLREIGMPLPVIGEFFAADAETAARLIDEQVARVTAEATEVRQAAATLKAELKAELGQEPRLTICALPGPVFAAAVDQVLATTDPGIPVLSGVRLEADAGSLALVATDRYRLALRTLVPTRSFASWAGTLAGDDLRASSSRLRRSPTVTIEADERTASCRTADGSVLHNRLLDGDFPDYRLLLDSLPPVTHRVTVGKRQVVRALERRAPETIGIRVSGDRLSLLSEDDEILLDGTATGAELIVWFELTTLYPALNQAIGDDLMLDLRGPDQPATVRSADDGDLTTLVMPCRKEP